MNPQHSQTLANYILAQTNQTSKPHPRPTSKDPKVQKKQQESDSPTERIPFKPLRYKFINLEYMEPKVHRTKREIGSRCRVSSDWEDLDAASPQDQLLNKLLRPLQGKKAVKDLNIHFPKDQFLNEAMLENIGERLGDFCSLKKLRIHFARIGGTPFSKKAYKDFARGLKKIPHLKELHLKTERDRIDHEGMKALGRGLSVLPQLEKVTLEFGDNSWNAEKGLRYLSQGLAHASLKTVNLSWQRDRKINDKGVYYLGKNLEKAVNVDNFCLLFNRCEQIGDLSVEAVNNGLKKIKNLKNLKVSFRGCDKISDAGVEKFLDGFENHDKLEKLWVNFRGCDRISAAGVQGLGEKVGKLKALKKLTLKFRGVDKITDQALPGLMKCIEVLNGLEEILLNFGSCRKITAEGFKELWQGLRGVASLKNVQLCVKGCSKNITENDILKIVEDARKAGKRLAVVAEKTHVGTYANSKSSFVYKS